MSVLFWLLCGLVLGFLIGWRVAHLTVAEECKRLGGFFVDESIFKCVAVDVPLSNTPFENKASPGHVDGPNSRKS